MSQVYENRFGRRGGRGARPWLLGPKVLVVALYFGGLGAALAIWLSSGFRSLASFDPRRLLILNTIGHLMIYLVVPALLLAIAMGLLLLLQHSRQFLRMRWLLVKLAGLAALVPGAHLFLSSRVERLREAFARRMSDDAATSQFTWGLAVTLAASAAIVLIGRLKPRLGQNWARSYAAATPPAAEP